MDRRSFVAGSGALLGGAGLLPLLAQAASAKDDGDTIVVAIGSTINSLDLHRVGTNRPSYMATISLYDRLLTFGLKTNADGAVVFDFSKLQGELAESWQMAPDGMSVDFKLKKAAKFWDGSPVTADDVKWSFDRAVLLGGFPLVQMKAGAMEKPEQFEIVDEHTFRLKFLKPSALTLPDLAVPVPYILSAKLGRAHATEKDPWATDFFNRNAMGSGAYKLERWDPGQQMVLTRNDAWVGGKRPAYRRVIIPEIPADQTRRAMVEHGDIGISFDIPAKDAKDLKSKGKVTVIGAPVANCEYVLCTNLAFEPFKDKKVRQAIAYALPYEQIFEQAAFGRGKPMWGAASATPTSIAWPQPFPYRTDLDKAKALMAESAHKDGFEVPLSYDLSTADWGEPTALLIQEGLAKIGIKTTLDKIPGANWRKIALVDKKLPLLIDNFGGWLDTPPYYFFWAYIKGHIFNPSNYDDAEMAALIDATLDASADDPGYAPKIKRMIAKAFEDVPRIPLWQPYLDSAMRNDVGGYTTWYHRQPDFRYLRPKGA